MNMISSIGLLADIVGVIIIFINGLPSKVKEHGGALILDEGSEKEKTRRASNKKIKQWSHIGLGLVLIGFILQLIGTNIDLFTKSIEIQP